MNERQNGMIIKSVVKAMNLINTVAESGSEGIKLNDLVIKLEETRSVVYKLVVTLVSGDYLRYNKENKRIMIGPVLLNIQSSDSKIKSLKKSIRLFLEKLAETTGHSCYLAVLENDKAFIIDAVDGKKHIRVFAKPGEMRYLHTTGLGKVLLAGLNPRKQKELIDKIALVKITENTITSKEELVKEIKDAAINGYAVSNEENYQNVKGIAAPIVDMNGNTLASISISYPDFMVERDELGALINAVRDIAQQASKKLQTEGSFEKN